MEFGAARAWIPVGLLAHRSVELSSRGIVDGVIQLRSAVHHASFGQPIMYEHLCWLDVPRYGLK